MKKCGVCQKPSTSQCAKCHQIYYCSKKCQKEDWKKHKISCGKLSVVKANEIIDRTEVAMNMPTSSFPNDKSEMLKHFTDMMFGIDKDNVANDWYVPDFEQEYAKIYPQEKDQIRILGSSKSSLKNLHFAESFINVDFEDFTHLMKRWSECSKELENFLTSPRKIGDIFTGKTKNPYVGDSGMGALSFSNMPKQSLILDKGKVHVAVGFVDLDFLLRAEIMTRENSLNQPNKFIGYEGSVYAVAKTNVIKEMMLVKAPIRSIIEVWFSTTWTMMTLNYFKNAVKNVLKYGNAPNNGPPNPTKNELHPKVRSLISHWNDSVKSPKSRKKAHKLWSKTFNFENAVFYVVADLVEPRDRVQTARHILTGEFPLMDDQQPNNLIASITMFNCNNGISPHSTSEFMHQMIPMDAILTRFQRKKTTFLNAMYEFLEQSITKICDWLSPPEGKSEKIDIYLHFQSVTNDYPELLTSIRQLDPWTMSWSNICDYFYAQEFHKMLQACSGEDTVHVMTSMNWITEVYGAHINEYDKSCRRDMLINAQKIVTMTLEFMDPSEYFRHTKIITHPYNLGDMIATRKVVDNWKDYFFKGQNLNIGEVSFLPYAQTHMTHTLLNITLTYNKEITIKTALTNTGQDDVFKLFSKFAKLGINLE
ncbi:13289_t:CDS:1 [Funneliformis geosporum]|uniref:4246_t:CDS:1 n=1 Tax=Funneliformis geosporum TaxID=1117311 RepID=A0A9W4SL84_9GLOM|nr:13289_t:CDS:1 [Funneliformis geosporum]CAI2173195.1 4246_t:CDS:1 [Funneliformis geosporum]